MSSRTLVPHFARLARFRPIAPIIINGRKEHQKRHFSAPPRGDIESDTDIRISEMAADDPGLNGGYQNPPGISKRQFRDPYAEWWDPQERRNFGEHCHEDEDIMGMFTPYVYTHASPGKAGAHFGLFVLAVLGLSGAVYTIYPDKPAVPRTFGDNGLERALGGRGALLARPDNEE